MVLTSRDTNAAYLHKTKVTEPSFLRVRDRQRQNTLIARGIPMSSDSDEQDADALVQEREVAAEPDAQAVEEVEEEAEGHEEEVEEETEEKESEKIEGQARSKGGERSQRRKHQEARSQEGESKGEEALFEEDEARKVEAKIVCAYSNQQRA